MILDAQDQLPEELEAEVCIAGAGPAGIVTALELARKGRTVVLVEGGGREGPGDGHALYEGAVDGRPYPLMGSRLRWLGGTSNHWGGWVRPLDPADFEDKAHFELPAWPFGAQELESWYRRAAEWCEVGSDDYGLQDLEPEVLESMLEFPEGSGFENRIFRFSPPTRFGGRYADELESARALTCIVNLNALTLHGGADSVQALEARTLDGGSCRIRADHFVLAMGGIENTRFLLNQAHRPGASSGLLGRCFMDHPGFRPGRLLARAGLRYREIGNGSARVMPVIAPGRSMLQEKELNNACILLSARPPDPHLPPAYWTSTGLPGAGAEEALHYSVSMINEPAPHPESRIELDATADAFGQRRARIVWHLVDSDFTRIFRLVERFIDVLGQSGLGRLQWVRREPVPPDQSPGVGYHHLGTTRMSATEDHGVVDSNGRVWDRDNLYVAGSSVFPTAGYANPTLTIVALASRLAHHLDARLEGSA